MFFVIKVNGSLLQLNVDPKGIMGEYRRHAQQLGKRLGYSPQETALLIISEAPNGYEYRINKINLTGWVNTGKVRLNIPDIQAAYERVMAEFGEDMRI
jgi:hypothetical protein